MNNFLLYLGIILPIIFVSRFTDFPYLYNNYLCDECKKKRSNENIFSIMICRITFEAFIVLIIVLIIETPIYFFCKLIEFLNYLMKIFFDTS